MATEIKVPTLGESVSTATVARWIKQAGEQVAADEALVELETDKGTVEISGPMAGVLSITVPEGGEVEVGAVLGSVEAGSGAAVAAPIAPPAAAPAKTPGPAANPQPGVNPPPRPIGPVSRPATSPTPAAAAPVPAAPAPAPAPAAHASISPTAHAPMPSAAKMMEEKSV